MSANEPVYRWCGVLNPHDYHLIGPMQLFDVTLNQWCPGSTLPGMPVLMSTATTSGSVPVPSCVDESEQQ